MKIPAAAYPDTVIATLRDMQGLASYACLASTRPAPTLGRSLPAVQENCSDWSRGQQDADGCNSEIITWEACFSHYMGYILNHT